MSKTDRSQQLSNWLNSEKKKDRVELEREKERLIRDLKKLKKGDLFPEPTKNLNFPPSLNGCYSRAEVLKLLAFIFKLLLLIN